MPAVDWQALLLPNLAGVGRMVPVHDTNLHVNAGSSWSSVAYTVPSGRVLALDSCQLHYYGGTAPTVLRVDVLDAASATKARLVVRAPVGVNVPITHEQTVWIPDGYQLRFRISGGAADTDMAWTFSGRLFDWSDYGTA